jgi:hypothetical protein
VHHSSTPLSPPPVLRYAYCTLFPSVKRLPAPLRASQPASQLGRERETRDSEGERHTGPKHTHTHTHTRATPTPTPSFSTINSSFLARLLQSGRRHRPLAAPRSIKPTLTPSRDSPVLSDAAFRHSNTPTLAFHQEIEPVASGRKIEEPPIGDAEGCIRWTPGLEAWTILKSNPFVNLVEILQHRTTPYTQCEQTDACELAESHQRIALPALASDDQTVLSLLSHIN